MGIKAVPSEKVTITACFQCVFPWRKRICKPAAGQYGCDGMKLKKVDGRSRDTAEIIKDIVYEHKFVLGGREKFTNHVQWCNFPSAFGINCVQHTVTGLIASENERIEGKTTPWMCVPIDPGHSSPKSTMLWLDRQRADPLLHRTPGYHWWSYNPQALSPLTSNVSPSAHSTRTECWCHNHCVFQSAQSCDISIRECWVFCACLYGGCRL